MEIGIRAEMPTYSGGLGVLAGDTIRSAADLEIPMVGITLLHRKGYFNQIIDEQGVQTEEPCQWSVEDFLEELPQRCNVIIEGRKVLIRAWRYEVKGMDSYEVPVYFLDTYIPENTEWDRTITDYLYGGDNHYRLCQEVVLGIGGIRMLRTLDYNSIDRFHMNEGHSGMLTLELLREEVEKAGRDSCNHYDIENVRKKCIFTTHTPVPAGHDKFPMELINRVLGHREEFFDMKDYFCVDLMNHVLEHEGSFTDIKDAFHDKNILNMTFLALNLSHYVNGVAKKHAEISRLMFTGYRIGEITNGVHAPTWVSKPFREVFDHYIPGWELDNFSLRHALSIPRPEVWNAHTINKKILIEYANRESDEKLDPDHLTIGFARRATSYKRAGLLFRDIERLKKISESSGPFQVIFSGKAHPKDTDGKEIIKSIFKAKEILKGHIKIVYLQNYDMELGKLMTSGVDLWLNTPMPPNEASGTSGMKAALNAVPSLSILDGWWIEGHIEGTTGWSIGENGRRNGQKAERTHEHLLLYEKLENVIIPLFYNDRDNFIKVMKHCIALNGSFFNTQRMMQQYVLRAYFL